MIVTGMVEAISDKFGKFGVLVNGKWYNTKPEWCPVQPSKGDNISFDDGGKNYLKNIKILDKGTGTLPTIHGIPSGGNKNLGVELGHASKIASEMAMCKFPSDEVGTDEWYKFWITHTDRVFQAMGELRKMKETGSGSGIAITTYPEKFPSSSYAGGAVMEISKKEFDKLVSGDIF